MARYKVVMRASGFRTYFVDADAKCEAIGKVRGHTEMNRPEPSVKMQDSGFDRVHWATAEATKTTDCEQDITCAWTKTNGRFVTGCGKPLVGDFYMHCPHCGGRLVCADPTAPDEGE